MHRQLELVCALLILLLVTPVFAAQSPPADLVLVHGHIITGDARDSVAQAIAIRQGVIVKVGSDADVMKYVGEASGVKVIDLQGRTATPGLIDTHAHIAQGGADELYGVRLSDATSVAEIVARVKAKIAQAKPGDWITGSGWDEGKLDERRYVIAADLDAVSPGNPVWLMHTTGHYGVANSVALKLANITAATADPPAGTIDRDAQGNPTGVLKEESAMDPITRLVPPTSPEQMRKGIIYIQQVLHSEGITSVKDPDISQTIWDAYKSVLEQGRLKERVCVLWHAGSTMESARKALAQVNAVPRLPASLGDDRLLSCGVKMFMDGSGGARTGWVYDDWLRNASTADLTSSGAGNRGYPQIDPPVYREMVQLFHTNGVPVGTHAVGDRAMDWVVDTYALVEKENPKHGLRHSIIHANLPTAHALEVMANLQKNYDAGYPEMQPGFLWWIGDIYAGNYGPKRGQNLEPFNTLKSRGILWSGGSDYPVTPLAACYGLWASAARQTAKGTYGLNPFGMAEAVDMRTALRSYTSWASRQMFLENKIGSLEPGKKADITVWDRDLYTAPIAAIKDLKCLMTIVGGEVVYTAPQFAANEGVAEPETPNPVATAPVSAQQSAPPSRPEAKGEPLPSDWCHDLPRAGYRQLERIPLASEWFEVYRVRPGVFAIYEPHQYEEVISYLITGSRRALLFDTGLGIGDMHKTVTQLTQLPVTVLNSHTHFDHIGDDWQFENILGLETPYTSSNARGATHDELRDVVMPQRFCGDPPPGFRPEKYAIPGFKISRFVKDGEVIDLGGRQLEVVLTPGHTPDALCLLDRKNKLLFTGDTFYAGPIFLYVPESDVAAYGRSVDKLAQLVPQLDLVLPSHNFPAEKPQMLTRLSDAFHQVQSGKAKFTIEEGLREYKFDGFSFLMR